MLEELYKNLVYFDDSDHSVEEKIRKAFRQFTAKHPRYKIIACDISVSTPGAFKIVEVDGVTVVITSMLLNHFNVRGRLMTRWQLFWSFLWVKRLLKKG